MGSTLRSRARRSLRQLLLHSLRRRLLRSLALNVAAGVVSASLVSTAIASPVVVGDGIPESLTGVAGDAAKGRMIVATRQVGLCLLCHTGPIPEEKFQGTLAPDLSGAGARLSAAQLRLRMVDSRKINPSSIMPAYFRGEALSRVGAQWQGKTILSAQQVEDVVAYLATLK